MFDYRRINTIEKQIMSLRLELISVIANINGILRSNYSNIVTNEYQSLKTKYRDIKSRIQTLKEHRESLR